ncbi:MAG TPA: acyl-CoA dehydrogenase family protein [Pseudonocardia sp.]|nr:acyl-CoA dehydrogenase family protein [Pseudonocardia sp.]
MTVRERAAEPVPDQAPESALGAEDLKLFQESMAKVLAGAEGRELVSSLEEQGWFELWAEQPRAAARALFGQQGRLARTSPVLTLLMGASVAGPAGSITAGSTSAGSISGVAPVLLPGPAAFSASAFSDGGWAVAGPDGTVRALAQSAALDVGRAAVLPVRDGDGLFLVEFATDALRRTPVEGLDPALGLCRVDATVRAGTPVLVGAEAELAWRRSVALGRRLLAEEMCGVVAEQLRLALGHAGSRSQFGRPIGSFQAVKHKLAEVHVALTVAELAAEEAWAQPAATTSLLAALLGATAVETANLHCQQVLGGIGFTWEHPFHRYARRGRVLAALLGTRAQLARELGGQIVDSGELPVLAKL